MNAPRLLSILAAAALLTACGSDPITTTKSKKLPVVSPQPGPYIGEPGLPGGGPATTPLPGAGANPQDNAQARSFIQKSIAFVQSVPTYGLEMHWMQKQGSKAAKGIYDVKGRAPRTTRIEITGGNNEGTKVLYTGGSTVKVRPTGLLGAVTVDLSLTDERIISTRGYTIPETDLKALMDQVSDPRHTAKLLNFAGDRAVMELTGGPLLKGCVKMVYQCDPNTGKPLIIEEYDAKEAVFRIDIRNFRAIKNTGFDI